MAGLARRWRAAAVAAGLCFATAACDLPSSLTRPGSPLRPPTPTGSSEPKAADFPPDYYAPAFVVAGKGLWPSRRADVEGPERVSYHARDGSIALAFERRPCDQAACRAAFDAAVGEINAQATASGGKFRVATDAEAGADWRQGIADQFQFVYRLPRSVQLWTLRIGLINRLDGDGYFGGVRGILDRQRTEDAMAGGNDAIAAWAPTIHDHARGLLAAGQKDEALAVLEKLIAAAPASYAARLDVAANTGDAAAARANALAVLEDAEDPEQLATAARIAGVARPEIDRLPVLASGGGGLGLVLVALPPCDVQLVAEAARIYETITGIPAKIYRPPGPWSWDAPDRVPGQRNIQDMIRKPRGEAPIDFAGWTRERYRDELIKSYEKSDALSRYTSRVTAEGFMTGPGQYTADPYLDRLAQLLAPYRSQDARTMYVGVTEANISFDNFNYVFAAGGDAPGRRVTILSYSMMTSRLLGEPMASRKRLAERLGKQMVPPSLAQLGIPRPDDPTDPHFQAMSVADVDRKGLLLSPPTREAIERLRR
jgi:predicted Zn-dependent protease